MFTVELPVALLSNGEQLQVSRLQSRIIAPQSGGIHEPRATRAGVQAAGSEIRRGSR
jgi:hypothetical protein